ncbi:MAG: hypothetical protein CME69_00395 [Halobacteriovorax sp.]|nr:hypothetical protein [Halobacteriovorax sp.]MEE3080340.1 hypothetical protein [Bdellovibrionota bacterium]
MDIHLIENDLDDKTIGWLEELFFNPIGEDVEFTKRTEPDIGVDTIMSLKSFKTHDSSKNLGSFFLVYNSEDEDYDNQKSLIEKIGKTNFKCLGLFDLSKPTALYIPFISSYLVNRTVVTTQKTLLKKLNTVMQSVLGQLQRVKGLHQKMVPVRNEKIRGVVINSRFCAGTSSGGEFFEFFKSNHKLWIFSINATSYITVGTFLSFIDDFRVNTDLKMDTVKDTLKGHIKDFEGLGELSVFAMAIDLVDFNAEILNIGAHELLNQSKILVTRNEKSYPDKSIDYKTSNISLEKGERIVLLSPGFFKNTRDKLGDDAYFQFLKKNWVESSEMIQEVTYQTKKKYNDLDFLPYDQTVLTIEVDKNVISKV